MAYGGSFRMEVTLAVKRYLITGRALKNLLNIQSSISIQWSKTWRQRSSDDADVPSNLHTSYPCKLTIRSCYSPWLQIFRRLYCILMVDMERISSLFDCFVFWVCFRTFLNAHVPFKTHSNPRQQAFLKGDCIKWHDWVTIERM